jgi:hypothetical protein
MTSRGIKQLDAASGGHVELDFQVTTAGDLFSLVDNLPFVSNEPGNHIHDISVA